MNPAILGTQHASRFGDRVGESLDPPTRPTAARRAATGAQKQKGPLAHPPEPGYPCYVSVLGELAWMAPREEPPPVYRLADAPPAPLLSAPSHRMEQPSTARRRPFPRRSGGAFASGKIL